MNYFIKFVLLLIGLMFAGFGVWFLLDPAALLTALGLADSNTTALIEVRAFYGGFEITFGLFLCAAAFKREWQTAALALAVLTSAGITIGRFAGIGLDGYDERMLIFALFEAGMTLLAAIAFWGSRRGAG